MGHNEGRPKRKLDSTVPVRGCIVMVKHHDQKQLEEESTYFNLQFNSTVHTSPDM